MFVPRKRYRQYLEPGSDYTKIPKSTYYRWKKQGRVNPEHHPDRRSTRATVRLNSTAVEARPPSADGTHVLDGSINISDNEESLESAEDTSPSLLPENILPSGSEVETNQGTDNEMELVSEISVTPPLSDSLFGSDDEGFSFDVGNESIFSTTTESANIPSSLFLTPEALNKPLVPSLSVTKFETLLMIFHLVMRHGMTGVFLEDMLKYTNTLVGDDKAIPASKYLFHQLFMTGKKLDIHFFCPTCKVYLGPSCAFEGAGLVTCDRCKAVATTTSMNNGNFFIALSIKDQLESQLKRKDIKVVYPVENREENSISDIFDGLLYKAVQQYCENHNLGHPLTLTFNTDGSPVFKSAKNSLWPIQFFLNEVDRQERFNVENVLLAGLWFGSHSPIMNVFFQPFVTEMQTLRSSGVKWTPPNGNTVQSPVFAICCCADSVAKPKVQKHHQFNGKYGCGYCLHPGVSTVVNEETGTTGLRYVSDDNYPYRTDRTLRQHMKEASRLSSNVQVKHVFGSLGLSPIISLPLFNLVFGFGIDWMHAALEGVTSKLSDLWFASKNHAKDFYIGDKIHLVDKRMSTLTPPSTCREARVISDRVHFKANEWRSFLFFYSLPSLIGILPNMYYEHFKKFVTAMHILLRDTLTYDEMQRADFLLYDFVWDFGDLYGEVNMVYNVHLLLHFGKIVSMMGPMWAYSAFCFESGNGRLVKLVNGTTGVATQIVKKYHMAAAAAELIAGGQYVVRDRAINFCNEVVSYKELKSATKINSVTVLGAGSVFTPSNEEKEILRNIGGDVEHLRLLKIFNRAVKEGVIYHARRHSRQERFDDSCVKLLDGNFAVIEIIFINSSNFEDGSNTEVWCFIRKIRVSLQESESRFPPHIKEACLDPFGPLQIIPFDAVQSKCVLMSCDGKLYVGEFPNNIEKD